MGRYVTIFRWKPETARAFAKRWIDFSLGIVPKDLSESMKGKWKWFAWECSLGNHFMFIIWEAKDENLPVMHAALMFMEEVCTVKTYPIMNLEEHGKAWDIFEVALEQTEKPESPTK
ncbi:MAG: hypothetical protein ACFFCS_26250 [Candidatus Hodarchaeota archaeon]